MRREDLFRRLFWPLSIFLYLLVFKAWFLPRLIFGGDFTFPPFLEAFKNFPTLPFVWNSHKGIDLGGNYTSTLWIDTFAQVLPTFLIQRGIPGLIVQKLVFFFPLLALGFFGIIFLYKTLFPKRKETIFLVPIIFGLNTYILMIVGGGQLGIGLAYALVPLVLAAFIRLSQVLKNKNQIIAGLLLTLQVFFDLRLTLLTVGMAFLYCLFHRGLNFRHYLKVFILPFFIVLGIHFYWLLPLVLVKRAALPVGYGEAGWVEFLSFANFSDSFSLLHPNWPENIFGKTYFMRPEFLLLPLFAFSSLLFLKRLGRQTRRNLLFLVLLGLVGAFLAKGSKPPFGGFYLWFFDHFPGMSAFRDPTKFYLLVAIAYSLLIPFTLGEIAVRIKKGALVKYLIFGTFFVYWLFALRPAFLGQLDGLFQIKSVPQEYGVLKDFLADQPDFFRTFWIPKRHPFAFYGHQHPAIENPELLSADELAVMGVKYVIIPDDTEEKIFLEDRKYDHLKRVALEEELDQVSWLKKIPLTEKITVYETPSHQDHFFIEDRDEVQIEWMMINPTEYRVKINNVQGPFNLVFSETYDPLWQARTGGKTFAAEKFDYREETTPPYHYQSLNRFPLNQTGDFEVTVVFAAQKYVNYGMIVSLVTFLLSLGGLALSFRVSHS